MGRALSLAVAALALAAAPAVAKPYLPPKGKVFAGTSGGDYPAGYAQATGKHPAVFQTFTLWGYRPDRVVARALASRTRPMIHISTLGPRGEVITPRGIARGRGDGYLLDLNRIAAEGQHVLYIRLMAEMNAHWNPYSAFDASGRSRGASHSTAAFRQAWRRVVTIVRGGGRGRIDRRLRRLGLPRMRSRRARLPRPKVSFLWVPQVAGAPDTRANSPRAYWPGGRYVDWVGTDFYSKFPNWSGLGRFYASFPRKPFAFGEWAVWGSDNPAFVDSFFAWVGGHRRARMLMYNQGVRAGGPFRLVHYPRSRLALARHLAAPRFAALAPEFR
jgi:hypothetical protein